MLVHHTRWTLRHHKMDAILSQVFPWILVHHTRKSADFSKLSWSLVLHTSWMLFRHTRGWTFFLHTMDVKDGARLNKLMSPVYLPYTVEFGYKVDLNSLVKGITVNLITFCCANPSTFPCLYNVCHIQNLRTGLQN